VLQPKGWIMSVHTMQYNTNVT